MNKPEYQEDGSLDCKGLSIADVYEWLRKEMAPRRFDSIKLNQKDALNQEKRVEPDGTTP